MFQIHAKKTGKGESVGLFIPLPDDLAKEFPSLAPEDTSPPHCTFLYIGEVQKEKQEAVLQAIDTICASFRGPVRASLGQVDYFRHPAKGRSVAILPVRFDKDMAGLRYKIYVAMLDLGLEPPEFSPLVYNAHVTLGYLDGLDAQYNGAIPQGAWSFNSVEVWDLPKQRTIYFGAASLYEIVARRYATKSDAEVEDEEIERLVRPSPKKKPPRTDLRRERVRHKDPDVDEGDRGDDDDLSLNYKRVARRWLASSKKKDQEPEWAKGKKFKHKTEGGDATDVGWGSLSPEERSRYTKDQAKEEEESVEKAVIEIADKIDLTSQAEERAKKEFDRLQEEDPDPNRTLEDVEKEYFDRAMRSMAQPTKQKKKVTPEEATQIMEDAFDEVSEELGGEGGDDKKPEGKPGEGLKDDKPKDVGKDKSKDEKPKEKADKPPKKSKGGYDGLAEKLSDLGPLDSLPESVQATLKSALGGFDEAQTQSLVDSFTAVMDAKVKQAGDSDQNWSAGDFKEARAVLGEGPKKTDPESVGKHLAKAVFADRILLNPAWAGGNKVKPKAQSQKALTERTSRAFDQYHAHMDKDERTEAAADVVTRLEGLGDGSPEAEQYNAVLDGIAMSQIINGEEMLGRDPPSEAFVRFAQKMDDKSNAHLLAGTLRDPSAADALVQDQFVGMTDQEVLDIAGGSDGPLKDLGDFLKERDEFGNYPFGEEHHKFAKEVLRKIASANMTMNHKFAMSLTGDSKKAEKVVAKETKKAVAANKKLWAEEPESFFDNVMAQIAKALKAIEQRAVKKAVQSFVYNSFPISEGLLFAASGTALQTRPQRSMSMSRLSKQAAQKITGDLDRLASLFQNEHERLGVSTKVATDFAYRCDLLSNHLEKQALTEYDPVDETKIAPHNFDPEEIGEEDAGPLVQEPEEGYMKGEYTQQENRELRERQEAGDLGMKPVLEEQTPTPGKQASLDNSISRLKKKASGSLQSVLTLGEMADRLRLCQSELKQVPASIGGTLAKEMMASIQKHLAPIDKVRGDLFTLEGKGESMDVLSLASVEKIEGAVQEVLPHIKGVGRKLSEEEVASSPTAQLKLQEWLGLVSPRITTLLDLSAKIVGEAAKEFGSEAVIEVIAGSEKEATTKEASEEFNHGYDLSE